MSKLSFRARALDASKPLPVFRCEDLPDLHEYASINRAVPQMPTGMEKEEESNRCNRLPKLSALRALLESHAGRCLWLAASSTPAEPSVQLWSHCCVFPAASSKPCREHHLQRAISAQQVYGEKRDNMVILYQRSWYDASSFSLDTEQPDYDLDSDDEAFVVKLKKKMEISFHQFEEMVDRLEKGSGQQLVSLPEAKLLLKEDDELIREVFDYWSLKRKACRAGCLLPLVKQERRDGSSTSDPYVAFRRRTEKMQTRKNRKNDEASYEKMLKLRRDLSRAVTILEMVKRREKSKRELLHLTLEVFEKRNVMSDYSGEVMAEVLAQQARVPPQLIPLVPIVNQYRHQDHSDHKDHKSKPEKAELPRQKRKYEKKQKVVTAVPGPAHHHPGPALFNAKDLNQYDFPSSDDEPYAQLHSGSSEAEEESDPDGVYAFRRKAGCQYSTVSNHSNKVFIPGVYPGSDLVQTWSQVSILTLYSVSQSLQHRVAGWPWAEPSEGGVADGRYRYSLATLTVPRRCLGLARRRVGRGGRVLLDRAYTDQDHVFHHLDPEALRLHPSPPPPPPPPPHSTLTDKLSSTSDTNTSQQRSAPTSCTSCSSSSSWCPRPSDLGHLLLDIKASRWRHFRPRTAPLAALADAHPLFRRLSRGLKRPLGPVAPWGPGGLFSKTLDVASAQLAASALLTGDQVLAFKAKEDTPPGGGVNGIPPPSGVFKSLVLQTAASLTPPSSTPATSPAFLHPGATSNSAPSSNNNGHGVPPTATTATTQVLLGNNNNNSLRLALPSAKRTHGHAPRTLSATPRTLGAAPRTLSAAVTTSALKLAAAAANCQKTKVQVPANSPLDLGPRENHDQDQPALSSISENTVAMEALEVHCAFKSPESRLLWGPPTAIVMDRPGLAVGLIGFSREIFRS
ncbi:hypothetical protein CRUP_014418 [Coryphaenoides rupestris]|nr:hypothetical protein CRUP_014418 [Coryphaenoides rupestris]